MRLNKYGVAFAIGLIISAATWLMLHRAEVGTNIRISEETVWQDSGSGKQNKERVIPSKQRALAKGESTSSKGQAGGPIPSGTDDEDASISISVYLTESRKIEKLPLEDYVAGVVAAEMPLDFQPAALEAQALAARTYIIRRLWLHDRSGVPGGNADVTDTQTHQVYKSLAEMKSLREGRKSDWLKVLDAVNETKGKIIVYQDEPIEALFFSTSNGYTENSEEVFPMKVPYLRSVASPWDKAISPRAQETVEMNLSDFYSKIGLTDFPAAANSGASKSLRILEWTPGRRVKELAVGGKKLTGEETRHLLGLRSASFEVNVRNGKLSITTFGSGHGVGMSQWGAEGMADAGKTAKQIVEYYYKGSRTEEVSKLALGIGLHS